MVDGVDVRTQLEQIAAGTREDLVVARLRDAAGSLGALVGLLDWLEAAGARLISLAPPLDTAAPPGAATVALLREIASWAPARSPGRPGVRHADPELARRIEALRRAGLTLQAIADRLNREGVPTPRGGRGWRPSSVQAALGYRRPRPPAPRRPAAAPAAGTAVTSLIEHLGPLGVFLLMVPESACIPVPSEVTLGFAGFAVSQGWMGLGMAVLAATAGNLVGSLLAYGLGATGLMAHVPGAGTVLERWGGSLAEHGSRGVFTARLMPLARTFVSLPAGAQRIPLGRFVGLTVAGCALWAVLFVLVGLVAGSAWGAVAGVLGKVLLGAGLVLALGAGHRMLTCRSRGSAARGSAASRSQ